LSAPLSLRSPLCGGLGVSRKEIPHPSGAVRERAAGAPRVRAERVLRSVAALAAMAAPAGQMLLIFKKPYFDLRELRAL
jgi:hypothetical protein